MRLKAVTIVLIIILSLLPMYMFTKYLERKLKPRESLLRFFAWVLMILAVIFVYTFLVVFIIKLLFPGA